MTRISIEKTDSPVKWIIVNSRKIEFANRIKSIKKVSDARWEVDTTWGVTLEVIGGRAAGGARNQWFLFDPTEDIFHNPLHLNSAAQAIRCIENC